MSDNYSDYSHSDNEEDDEDFDEKSECKFVMWVRILAATMVPCVPEQDT